MSTATRADKRDRDRVTAIADGAALPLAKATPRVREEVAVAFGSEYAGGSVRPSQRRSAEAILKLFIQDTAESVRAAIARCLVTCPFLPLSLARTMAADIDAIAVPMIHGSEVFDDAALLDIVRSGVVARQVAVATRDTVSQPVAGALVGTGDASVVAALLANDGARIAPGDLAGVVRDFGDDPTIKGLVIGREVLPLEVLDSLLDSAGLAFGEILEDAMDLPGEIVKRVCTLAREQLTVSHVRERENLREVEELADRLGQQGRLTSTLLLRALCTGDTQFFAIGMGRLSGVEVGAIRKFVQSGDYHAIGKIARKAGWTAPLIRAATTVLKLYNAEKPDRSTLDPDMFATKAVDRLTREFGDLSPHGLDGVLAQICWKLA